MESQGCAAPDRHAIGASGDLEPPAIDARNGGARRKVRR
jgi:hypothetical protein